MFGWMRRSPNHLRRLNDFMAEQPAFDIGYIASEVSNQAVIEDVIFDRIRDRHRQMWQAQYSSFYAQLLQEPETRAALNAANGQLSALNDELAATDKMLETSDRKPEPWSALSVTAVILLILGYVIVASFSVTAFATFNIATDRAAYGEGGDYRAFFTSFIPAGAPLALEICYLRIPYATVRRWFQAAAFVGLLVGSSVWIWLQVNVGIAEGSASLSLIDAASGASQGAPQTWRGYLMMSQIATEACIGFLFLSQAISMIQLRTRPPKKKNEMWAKLQSRIRATTDEIKRLNSQLKMYDDLETALKSRERYYVEQSIDRARQLYQMSRPKELSK